MAAPRVLLVHPSDGGDGLAAALETAGWRVASVETATAAVATLSTGDPDCLVSELELPGDDGLALRSAVRQLDPELPVVLFGDRDSIDRSVAVESPHDRYIPRNGVESVDRLVAEVRKLEADSESAAGSSTAEPSSEPIPDTDPSTGELNTDLSTGELDTDLSTKAFGRAVERAPIGVSLCDPSLSGSPLVYVNDGWEEVTGYGAAEVLGRNPRLLQGPDTDPEPVARLSEAITNEEPATVELRNYRRDGTPFWNELTIAPIHEDGELVSYAGFQVDVSDRREAERRATEQATKLAAERRTLRRVLDRINGLLRAVSGVLVESTDRPQLEQGVCERITDESAYTAAWIGTVGSADTELHLSASSGLSTEPPASVPLGECPSAVQQAADTDEPYCCSADETAGVLAPGTVGGRRLLVVPLCYGDRRYGLLGVYGTDETALDSRDREVIIALGGMIANGLHAVETARMLTTDHVTELRIELRDDSFELSRIAAVVGGPVDRCGTTKTASGDCELYLTTEVPEVDPDPLASLPFVESTRLVAEADDQQTIAVTVPAVPPDDTLAEFGAVVTGATATADGGRLTVEAPPQQDVRSLLEALESAYDGVDLRARTERDRRDHQRTEFAAVVADRLTERQTAALEAAHYNGYFEWPRPVDGSEIAASMDITRQTFHQHLRAAEAKLVDAYITAC